MITVNGSNVKPGYKLKTDDVITVCIPGQLLPEVKPEKIDLDIIYEDEDILIVNKPKDMVVHPAAGNYEGTLVNALMWYCGDNLSDVNGSLRPGIVHRLDKDTSGLLIVAKKNKSHEKLAADLKNHDIQRTYIAITEGVIKENGGTVNAPIGRHPKNRKKMAVNHNNGREAISHFKVLERFQNNTYVEVSLETGRTHQIRVHMAHIGHPVVGDTVYGRKKQKYNTNGQVLHAYKLKFKHPSKDEIMEFQAPIPEYFKKLLNLIKN